MFDSLRQVKGVGDKVYGRLLERFGTEEAVLRILERQDFQELLGVLPLPKAVEIAREVHAEKRSFRYIDILKTPETREIYNSVISVIRSHASTDYARLMIGLFYPTKDLRELERRREEVREGVMLFKRLRGDKLGRLKKILRGFRLTRGRRKRISGKAVVTDDEALYEDLKEFSDVTDIFLLKEGEDMEFLRHYDMVRVVSMAGLDTALSRGLSRSVVLCSPDVVDVLPEAVLSFFTENRETVDACAEALELLGDELSVELRAISEKIQELEEARKRASHIFRDLPTLVRECLEEANARVVSRVEEMGVSFSGKEMLQVLSRLETGDVYASLPRELREILAEEAKRGEEECARRLGLESEKAIFSGLFSTENLYPLEVDKGVLAELEAYLTEEGLRAAFRKEQRAAAYLRGKEQVVERAVYRLLNVDYLLALGEFSASYNASPARIGEGLTFSFREGKHLLLRKLELQGKIKVQPVSYSVGDASPGEARVTVLTGANSGGKTTLLELMAQMQIMAQSGLPVLAAEAEVPLVDEVYFYGRRRGSSSAGAFEVLLRSLADIPRTRAVKLVLADEIEAVTEPGAAAKILSALLELFSGMESCLAVVVTHLGEEIGIEGKARIDGIEARGLDGDLNLVVDRNPVLNSIARSTPELILERLSKTDDKHREFYREVLKKFK
jgi:hypothetical protein